MKNAHQKPNAQQNTRGCIKKQGMELENEGAHLQPAQNNEGEVLGVPEAGLDEEFISPTVQGLKWLGGLEAQECGDSRRRGFAAVTTVPRMGQILGSFSGSSSLKASSRIDV